MLGDSPLSPVVAPRKKREAGSPERNESIFPSILRSINEAISDFSSPSPSSPSSPSFEECEFIATNANVKNDPDGLKASTQMSVYSSGTMPIREGIDPPPDEDIVESSIEVPLYNTPEDTPKDPVFVKDPPRYSDNAGGCCNVIVDNDDDSFTDEKDYEGDELMPMSKKNDVSESYVTFPPVEDAEPGTERASGGTLFDEEAITTIGNDSDKQENDTLPVISDDLPGVKSLNSDEANQKGEYLNITENGDLVVLQSPPEPESESTPQSVPLPASYSSYHDVHKGLFSEIQTQLKEQSDIVRYVDDWEKIVHMCVQSRYAEYSKIRSGLCHYEKKVDSLMADIDKLKLRNRLIPPKQIEKLERNQIKLEGTRKTHDKNGELLILFLDEVVIRSWRDAFPLLRMSIESEVSFACVNQEHLAKLCESLRLLEIIGNKEFIETEGRLATFDNCNPEDIYTGEQPEDINTGGEEEQVSDLTSLVQKEKEEHNELHYEGFSSNFSGTSHEPNDYATPATNPPTRTPRFRC
jgi:hypothetical protein